MTRLIEFLIALGIVAGLFVIVALVLPSHRHISESVETNRRMTIVYDTLNSMRRFKDWNPLVVHDPKAELKLSGPEEGVGARLDYSSKEGYVGQGSWAITESEQNKKIVVAVEDPRKGTGKTVTFDLEPTGKNDRNVKITQSYDVDYGWNLFGRYAGLYVSRHVGDDLKLGLSRLTNMLATVPNVDYRAEDSQLANLRIVDVPAEDLLVITAGNIDRDNETIKKSIKDNQEWIRRVMESNNLEAAGPVRIVTTDFGAEKYAFDVVQPVRKRTAAAAAGDSKNSAPAPAADAAATTASTGPLKVTTTGTPVEYVHAEPRRAATASYTGYMAGLDTVRNALRAWALTTGHEVTDRPYESWTGGVDKAFTAEGTYDIYWAIK